MFEQENPQPKNNLSNTLIGVALVFVVVSVLWYLYSNKNIEVSPIVNTPDVSTSTQLVVSAQPLTDAEKRVLLEQFQQVTSSAPLLSDKQKAKLLNDFEKLSQSNSTSTPLTDEQKRALLESI